MSRKSRITISGSLSLLAATATALFAEHAVAGNQSIQGPLTTGPCLATFSKPPVTIFGSGAFKSPPNVQFDFWIADADTKCPAKNVKVTWLYQIADKTTKVSVKTVLGSTTLPQVFQNTAHLCVNCTATGPNTYCKDASATIVPSSSGPSYSIKGSASASIGPVAP
jgi:hypothetical protein